MSTEKKKQRIAELCNALGYEVEVETDDFVQRKTVRLVDAQTGTEVWRRIMPWVEGIEYFLQDRCLEYLEHIYKVRESMK